MKKVCTRCLKEQPLENFRVDPRYAGSRTAWCSGCINERRRERRSENPERVSYDAMIDRCFNPNNPRYGRYGGRGISVCDRWVNSFDDFLRDMGPRPEGCSIDRIDNDGDYTPENCRWATSAEQGENRSTTCLIEYDGLTLSHRGWERRMGFSRGTIYNRLKLGWDIDTIMTTPNRKVSP